MIHKWESTVEDLSNELKNAHQEVEERQKILDQVQQEMNDKLRNADIGDRENQCLRDKVKDIQAENEMLSKQRNEKDLKLKN